MNVLILTGRFGMGHYSASASIEQQIKKEYHDANVTITDIFEYTMPKLYKAIYGGFKLIVSKANLIYNFVYKNTAYFDATQPLTNVFVKKISKLIQDKKPDIIVSTLPLCSRIISKYKEQTGSKLPLVTCITDISTHNEWISSHTDIYLVATDYVKTNLIHNGIKPEAIFVSGIPVKESFKKLYPSDICFHDKMKKHLLIMGGGLGLIPVKNNFYKRLNKEKNIEVTVIMGNNKREYNKIYGKYENIKVIGYTDKVNEYMANADLIISKAGGITLFETIYSELPMLVFCPFLVQEKNNAYFIEKGGFGEIIWNRYQDVAASAIDILNNNNKLESMKNNIIKIKGAINNNAIEKAFSDFANGVVA